ncbi:MAG: hypothetical protein N3D20_00435 [Candidatus Pacearchaeota archaeon]|nr:hypothetical protein [Candidatus Pacearchaeota archaeon]
MNFIKFYFTKISANKEEDFSSNFSLNTNIDISKIEKEDIPNENNFKAIKISFTFSVEYFKSEQQDKKLTKSEKQNQFGEVLLKGKIIFASPNEEAENISKSWEKKQIPEDIKLPLFNFILRKCASKAFELEDTLNLPPHFPLPSIKPQNK